MTDNEALDFKMSGSGIALHNVSVVLQGTKYPENIGSTARAMKNMGLNNLILVNPVNTEKDRMLMMSTHGAADIIENMQIYNDLREALSVFQYVVGTTARLGGQRQTVRSPKQLIRELAPLTQNNQAALLFGPEDRGLTNAELQLCHIMVNIPTAEFASLNVSQAVLIICYELLTASIPEKTEFTPRLAGRHELDGMYDQLRDILVKINYINHENPEYWMTKIKQFGTRIRLKAKEVSIIRGICRQIEWYAGKRYQDGFAACLEKADETD